MKSRVKFVLQQSLAVTLKERGFTRLGGVYARESGDIAHIIEVQQSRWNDQSKASFTFNCGVHVPGVTSTFRVKPEPKRPRLADCCVTVRVGMLEDSRLDIWWKLSVDDDPHRDLHVAKEIVSATTRLMLPFLDRFQSEEQIALFLSQDRSKRDEFVEPRVPALQHAYAALLWARLGDTDRALECLNRAQIESRKTPLEDVVTRFAEEWERC
jgi:Domain of unknown function (DUF4304)